MNEDDHFHWADDAAKRVIKEKGNKKLYTCAAGITPSGTVHIGNFREIMTVDLVCKSLKDLGKKTRFIYSWDDYDVFRKVPVNMPNQELLKKYLRQPIVDTPDTFGCHKSYAEHNEKVVEEILPIVGINPEFLYQSQKYRKCEYAEEIKFILNNKLKVKKILDKYREEPLPDDWYPVSIYCEKCNTDDTEVLSYDGEYSIKYKCKCDYENTIDFRKKGNVKLPWRVDWPMRWHYESVDFEPGGKEHSTEGGSYSTARLIIKELYNEEPPTYQKYDFIILKGIGGKMSSSSGNVITLKEMLEIYEPEVIRFLFASARPESEFAISFDLDVLKVYEDFDKIERIYFDKEEGKKLTKEKRIYELSCIEIPKKMPEQYTFRHLSSLVQLFNGDIKKVLTELNTKDKRIETRAKCALNWINKYAPEDMKFKLQDKVNTKFNEQETKALKLLATKLKNKYTEDQLAEEIYNISKESEIEPKDFFKICYRLLINKEKGPKLATFILIIGKEKVIKLINSV
ncbi:MAG: lysine--tRNA ligase [Candidatus Nanoarchaeia archaeon]|nr:lysine--tRNA ligase [Candidatus Nanoarchaeia archaeon]